ncbi:MAG: NAD(P)H-dependent oxidoreductase [Cyclobacteriaceae bacterium]|nr:NAD(P)H-dependent oxidoreductase [Cyclobacteriaceae bacterium]
MKILAISGSNRAKSSNEAILNFIKATCEPQHEVEIFKGIYNLPHFNPDIDQENPSQEVLDFRQLIEKSNAIIICTPEYVFSLPGTLKNALEWTVSANVFSYKPIGLIVASSLGEKAMEALDIIMKTLIQTEVPNDVKLLISGSRAKFNSDGKLTDKETILKITNLVDAVISSIKV